MLLIQGRSAVPAIVHRASLTPLRIDASASSSVAFMTFFCRKISRTYTRTQRMLYIGRGFPFQDALKVRNVRWSRDRVVDLRK
jgi:hypothetical protein